MDEDRKRGVHANAYVAPKNLPLTSQTRADTRKFAWGYYLLFIEEKVQFGFDKIIKLLNTLNAKTTFYYPVHVNQSIENNYRKFS